jgi:Putative Actinobacterial Holin-X, holin superfamily III
MTAPTGARPTPQHEAPSGFTADRRQTEPPLEDVSVGQLIANISHDMSALMRQEVELAKAELKTEVTKTAKGAGMLGGAGFAGWMTALFLSLALGWALANVMDAGWAFLIVGAIWAIAAAVLFLSGRKTLKTVHPTPERTVETVKQVPGALKPGH